MAKKPKRDPDEKLPPGEAERARDEVLKRMGKTPPKPHARPAASKKKLSKS